MFKLKIFAIFIIGILIAYGCKTVVLLPPGNLQKEAKSGEVFNTPWDDNAPAQPSVRKIYDTICADEFHSAKLVPNDGVKPSATFLKSLLGRYYSPEEDGLCYYLEDAGFFAVAFPNSEEYAQRINNPVKGLVGGTDIFEFKKIGSNFQFTNLGTDINSKTWDGHPYAILGDNGTLLLLWASDREDPYKNYVTEETIKSLGNTNLFFAFRNKDGKWSSVHSFSEINGDINTSSWEMSPSLFCVCHETILLFSSNRSNYNSNDFDIYAVNIYIDFQNQNITLNRKGKYNTATRFEKLIDPLKAKDCLNCTDAINTLYTEKFPIIAKPYDSTQAYYLYLSSNRFPESDKEKSKCHLRPDSLWKNVGGMDIYRFPITGLECKEPPPPQVNLIVYVIDSTGGYNKILSTSEDVIVNINGDKIREPKGDVLINDNHSNESSSNPASFNLKLAHRYNVKGGALYNVLDCNKNPESDSVLIGYSYVEVKFLDKKLEKRKKTIEYDTIIKAKTNVEYSKDTVYQLITVNDLKNISSSNKYTKSVQETKGDTTVLVTKTIEEKFINLIKKDGDYFQIVKEVTTKSEWKEGGRTEKRKRDSTYFEEVLLYDTIYHQITRDNFAISEKTKRGGIETFNINQDTEIYDTIFVVPRYFLKKPCEWKYVHQSIKYRKNVPYFQTCFWEVNTTENFKNHRKILSDERYSDATFIELHPNNQYWGYRSLKDRFGDASKRNNRIIEYSDFARIVDKNLLRMADEIANRILPSFDTLVFDRKASQTKLIIQIRGYSDFRQIYKGYYIPNPDGKYSTIKYISSSYNSDLGKLESYNKNTYPEYVTIKPNASLVGADNDTLSKLRAFFGYRELLPLLHKSKLFNKYSDMGLVFYPDSSAIQLSGINQSSFERMLEKYKIIILVEGRMVDASLIPSEKQYKNRIDDYYPLDSIRRIDVIVNIIDYVDGKVIKSECCSKKQPPIPQDDDFMNFSPRPKEKVDPQKNKKAGSPFRKEKQIDSEKNENLQEKND